MLEGNFLLDEADIILEPLFQTTTHLFSGPIAAALVNKFGCRPVAIAGAAFASVSFFVSTFSPNIQCMILFYGFCGGKMAKLKYCQCP